MLLCKKISLFIVLLIFSYSCSQIPQELPQSPTHIDSIVYHGQFLKNYNDFYLASIVYKIQENRGIKIRIFGDSHIAGDFFSDELRSLMFQEVDSPGFLYPLQPKYHQNITAKYTHRHFSIHNSLSKTQEDYPLGGIIATAMRINAFIQLSLHVKQIGAMNTTIIFRSPNQKDSFKVVDSLMNTFILKSPTPHQWSFFSRQLHFPIKIYALQKNVALGGYFITKSLNDNIIDTLGINGASSYIWKKWNANLMLRTMQEMPYDLIIIAYGSNDIIAQLEPQKTIQNIKELVRFIKHVYPNTAILLLTPPTVTIVKNKIRSIAPNFYATQDAIEKLAQEEKLLLFNTHEFMESNGGKDIWIIKNLSKKDLHLTPLGYRFVARKLFQEIYPH